MAARLSLAGDDHAHGKGCELTMTGMDDRVEVMRGALADYDLAQVLQVVSIGRQFVAIEVSDAERSLGTIFAIGGRVIAVDSIMGGGLDAFFRLCELDAQTFRVFRLTPPESLPKPLGLVRELLGEHRRRRVQTPTVRAPSPPMPSPVPRAPPAPTKPPPAAPAKPSPPAKTVPPASKQVTPAKTRGPVLAVSSPKGGVGKTTIALNLALSLARQGHRTVLIDGDPNGDIMSCIDARDRPISGAYDLLFDHAQLPASLLKTTIDELSILPASGQRLPEAQLLQNDLAAAWRVLFDALMRNADVIIVDTAAGTYGPTFSILRAATHVLGVLQAETIAHRSFGVFARALESLPEVERPAVLGVVLNMLQPSESASVDVLSEVCGELPPSWLFDVTIPRHPAFLRASSEGLPLGLVDDKNPPPVAWLFEGLASEVSGRLHLHGPVQKRTKRLLL